MRSDCISNPNPEFEQSTNRGFDGNPPTIDGVQPSNSGGCFQLHGRWYADNPHGGKVINNNLNLNPTRSLLSAQHVRAGLVDTCSLYLSGCSILIMSWRLRQNRRGSAFRSGILVHRPRVAGIPAPTQSRTQQKPARRLSRQRRCRELLPAFETGADQTARIPGARRRKTGRDRLLRDALRPETQTHEQRHPIARRNRRRTAQTETGKCLLF